MLLNEVYNYLLDIKNNRGAGLMVLLDPDKTTSSEYLAVAESAEACGVDALLVGTSFSIDSHFSEAVKEIKNKTKLPVIIFPGSYAQLTPHADAVLFTSLISGRNPNYLIDEQVKGAPLVKKFELEAIPTGYMLIESGTVTSVEYISNTKPIPRDKTDIVCGHALAAQYMGMRAVYLEAGSGAQQPVPVEIIEAVNSYIEIPIITGGGLRRPEDCQKRIEAGADFVVVGNHLEHNFSVDYLSELALAVHIKESQKV